MINSPHLEIHVNFRKFQEPSRLLFVPATRRPSCAGRPSSGQRPGGAAAAAGEPVANRVGWAGISGICSFWWESMILKLMEKRRPALLYGHFSCFAMFHMGCKPLANFDTHEVEGSMTRWVDWGDDGEVDWKFIKGWWGWGCASQEWYGGCFVIMATSLGIKFTMGLNKWVEIMMNDLFRTSDVGKTSSWRNDGKCSWRCGYGEDSDGYIADTGKQLPCKWCRRINCLIGIGLWHHCLTVLLQCCS